MSSWTSYPKVWNLGHKAIADLLRGEVVVQEKVDGCAVPETPVLCSDLTWRPAGDLRQGDGLVSVEYSASRMRLQPGAVTITKPIKKACVRVVTDCGEVVVTEDHPLWVRKGSSNNPAQWVVASRLKIGQEIASIPTWKTDTSWQAGYLAGQFDGEGSLVKHGHGRCLSHYQRVSDSQRLVRDLLTERGFCVSEDIRKRQENYSEVVGLRIRGGWTEHLRFLGSIRPQRLLESAEKYWAGAATNFLQKAKVLAVEAAGEREVTGLSTSNHTYFAGGLASHNSQFSFGVIDGVLKTRSRGREFDPNAPDSLFSQATAHVRAVQDRLVDGVTYRAEVISKPKHNTLMYGRVPDGCMVLFDVTIAEENYLGDRGAIELAAGVLGVEAVPELYRGRLDTFDQLNALLDQISFLGVAKIEGVVIKNYGRWGVDGKPLFGKLVSEAFKETNKLDWKDKHPGSNDIKTMLGEFLRKERRWEKAMQRMRDNGTLTGEPADIGPMIREVAADVEAECADVIKERLWEWAKKDLLRASTRGLPEWYKNLLAQQQFTEQDAMAMPHPVEV